MALRPVLQLSGFSKYINTYKDDQQFSLANRGAKSFVDICQYRIPLPHSRTRTRLTALRHWAGKTSYVHLAPEHEYRTKHLM